MSADWRLVDGGGALVARSAMLERVAGVVHAFSTRHASALAGRAVLGLRQVHGARVVGAARAARAQHAEAADALVARREEREHGFLCVRTADCVPLLLADRTGETVAAVHAGWRGVAAGIGAAAVAALGQAGTPPSRLVAALGPAIGPCCYEVEDAVAGAVAVASAAGVDELARRAGPGRLWLDLRLALGRQLVHAGVEPAAISAAPWCTRCAAELFFSYRRDGPAAGRMLACIGWDPAAP